MKTFSSVTVLRKLIGTRSGPRTIQMSDEWKGLRAAMDAFLSALESTFLEDLWICRKQYTILILHEYSYVFFLVL